jgi:hypothetical protein
VIHKTLKCTASTRVRKEGQFSGPNDFQNSVPNLKLASGSPVVPSRAKSEISTTSTYVLVDTSITFAVQRSTISHIGSSREYKESA